MQPIKVTFLGTGDAFSAGGRQQAAILVQHPDASFLMDCGATILAALNNQNLSFETLDYIILSHLHGDHIGGLPFLFLHLCYIEPRSRALEILGPEGLDERIYQLYKAMYSDAASEPLPFELIFTPLKPKKQHIAGALKIEPFHVPHLKYPPSLGYSLELDGRRIVYSGDSGWTEELAAYAKDADLFICECSFYESQAPHHLNYPTIVERLADCGARRMVLTHLGQEVLERIDQLDLEFVNDGSVVTL
jgi:ribonuclease BN (tRNA processing enzyme)